MTKRSRSEPTGEDLLATRRKLPIWSARRALLREVAAAETLILTGETGSGKSTQVPQFLHAAGYTEAGAVGITQPRRVAAVSLARRVAAEQACPVGSLVGYAVRFDESFDRRPPKRGGTAIKFVTDGMLLREAASDPLLSAYSALIVDEAHERSLASDVVLALLKSAQARRRSANGGGAGPLKLVVMSATLEVDTFCAFFDGAPAVQVLGRSHPVEVSSPPNAELKERACPAAICDAAVT